MGTPAYWEQLYFKFRDDDDTEAAATWREDLNTDTIYVNADLDKNQRLRIGVDETGGNAGKNEVVQWQYKLNTGSWINITTISSVVKAVASIHFAQLDDCTQQITSGGFDTTNDCMSETGAAGSTSNDPGANSSVESELCFQVVAADVVTTDYIDIRIGLNGDLDVYTEIPRITITLAAVDVDIGAGDTLYDSVGVDDDTLDLALELVPNVFDEVDLEEDVVFGFISSVDQFDEAGIEEDVAITVFPPDLLVDVYDEVDIEESASFTFDSFIDTYDEVTADEGLDKGLITELPDPLAISVYDECSLIEDRTVSISEAEETLLEIDIYDEVTVEEDITIGFESSISIYEEVGIDEDIILGFVSIVNVYDEVGVDEYWLKDITSFVSVYDEVSIEEYVLVSLPDALVIDLNDEVTVTEADYTPQLGAAGDRDVNLYDSVDVAEYIEFDSYREINLYDSVTVADKTPVYQLLYDTKVSVSVVTGISVYDDITLTEDISFVIDREISIVDSIGIAEDITTGLSDSSVNVTDAVGITEAISLAYEGYISVVDSVGVAENVSIALDDLTVSVVDDVTVSEDHEETVYLSGGIALEVDIYDSVDITEDITFEFISYISVDDEVTVVESTELAFESTVSVYDSVAVTEDYSVAFDLVIDVYDAVTVVDTVTILTDININVSDEVSIAEDIERSGVSYVFVYDDISLAEDVTSYRYTGIYTVSVYDSVSTLEDIDLLCYQGVYLVSVYDEVSTDENVTVSTALAGIDVEDSVGVADVPVVELGTATLTISINDEINLGEDVQAGLSDLSPSVSDSIVVSEYLNVPAFYSLIIGSVLIIEDVVLILPEFNVTMKPTQMLTLFQNVEFNVELL